MISRCPLKCSTSMHSWETLKNTKFTLCKKKVYFLLPLVRICVDGIQSLYFISLGILIQGSSGMEWESGDSPLMPLLPFLLLFIFPQDCPISSPRGLVPKDKPQGCCFFVSLPRHSALYDIACRGQGSEECLWLI